MTATEFSEYLGDLTNVQHPLFEGDLFQALKKFVVRSIDHESCVPLKAYLKATVLSCPSQQQNVEGSFNIMTIIRDIGSGRASVAKQQALQAYMQNQCLPARPTKISGVTGKPIKYKSTKDNLTILESSIKSRCAEFSQVSPEQVDHIEANYVKQFAQDKLRARPKQRKQYNIEENAKHVIVCRPYMGEKPTKDRRIENEESSKSSDKESDRVIKRVMKRVMKRVVQIVAQRVVQRVA